MEQLLASDVDKSETSTPSSSACSSASEQNVFVFDYDMSLDDRLKEFAKETATAGPKLVSLEEKGEANATKKIKELLKNRFKINKIRTPSFDIPDEEM